MKVGRSEDGCIASSLCCLRALRLRRQKYARTAMITRHTPAATPPAIGAADDFFGESIKATAVVDGAVGVVDIVDVVDVVDVAVPTVIVDDAEYVEVVDPVGL